jgi:signal transduction histidine kinase
MNKITWLFRSAGQALDIVPKEYSQEINYEVTNKNVDRIVALSVLLIFMNVLMIMVDLTVYYPKWSINSGYINLFYAHGFMVIERCLYLLIFYVVRMKKMDEKYKLKNFFVIYSCIVALVWCSYLSVNAQGIHGQISAFIIGSFSIASTVLLFPMQSLTIFIMNSTFFAIMLYFTPMINGNYASNAINTLFVAAFSLLMSYINISMYCKDYKNKKTIQKQAAELELSKSILEETVKQRTEDLMKTNEQLVKEMEIRNEIERKSMKISCMYEENAMLLRKVREYEELRNVFFANLSHELRTPLNVIFSAQQMMHLVISKQSCTDCKNQIIKYNRIVKQNCYRLIRLIGNLIDITKIDAKYFEINKKNCDIVNVVENITQSVADYIKDKKIELFFETEIEKRIIAFDPDKVERIMLNLLSNAVKFTPENGQINVKVRLLEGYVAIQIIDNGIGISKEMQDRVFERFIQADKSIKRSREGSGIGLSLVKSLVDLHEGKILLKSEPGKGSEFIVELPDEFLPYENGIACVCEDNGKNIETINIEFSDIYA